MVTFDFTTFEFASFLLLAKANAGTATKENKSPAIALKTVIFFNIE